MSNSIEIYRESDSVDGKGEVDNIKAKIVHYEADTYNASMLTQIAPHPLNPQDGQVVCIRIGGLSKRAGLAKDLFGVCLSECDGDIRYAVKMSYRAADAILKGEKQYPFGYFECDDPGLSPNQDEPAK